MDLEDVSKEEMQNNYRQVRLVLKLMMRLILQPLMHRAFPNERFQAPGGVEVFVQRPFDEDDAERQLLFLIHPELV
jgi:hypothetical protein